MKILREMREHERGTSFVYIFNSHGLLELIDPLCCEYIIAFENYLSKLNVLFCIANIRTFVLNLVNKLTFELSTICPSAICGYLTLALAGHFPKHVLAGGVDATPPGVSKLSVIALREKKTIDCSRRVLAIGGIFLTLGQHLT